MFDIARRLIFFIKNVQYIKCYLEFQYAFVLIAYKKFTILNNDEIIDFCKADKHMVDEIKAWSKDGVQFKLILDVDAKKENSSAEIYLRKPEDEQYLLWSAGKVKTETALNFTGYPNVEVFLQDLNNEESQTEYESVVEDEEDEELE